MHFSTYLPSCLHIYNLWVQKSLEIRILSTDLKSFSLNTFGESECILSSIPALNVKIELEASLLVTLPSEVQLCQKRSQPLPQSPIQNRGVNYKLSLPYYI